MYTSIGHADSYEERMELLNKKIKAHLGLKAGDEYVEGSESDENNTKNRCAGGSDDTLPRGLSREHWR